MLGIGTEQGGPIPLDNGGFLKDALGSIVITGLPLAEMGELAREGNGTFQSISAGDRDVLGLLAVMQTSRLEQEAIASDLIADIWYEQGPWLILILLPVAALAFRRGALMVVPLILVLQLPPAEASAWDALWKNSDQRASQEFQQGDHQQAAELFNDPEWKGSAWYRAGDYEKALQFWEGQDSETARYNRGNALAKLGRFEEAIKAYEELLEQNPQHEDADYNKKLIEQAMQQQQQSNQQQSEESKESSDADQNQQADESGQNQQQSDANPQQSEQQESESTQANNAEAQDQSESSENQQPDSGEQEMNADEGLASLDEKLSDQVVEQWLRKIPDDPGGLLRRKFLYQYQNRGSAPTESNPW